MYVVTYYAFILYSVMKVRLLVFMFPIEAKSHDVYVSI